jgi:putative copper resistance protein D
MLLVVVRGLFVACALSGFGAALFALTMPIARDVNSRLHASIERQVGKIMSLSLAGALVVGYPWLLLETHAVAGTTDLVQTVTAIPTVLFDTRFGQILVLQALAIACALAAVWRGRDILAASLAGTAVMLEAGHSHAFAMAHIPLLLSQMLHLTAAGAWLGGLLPLLIVVREAPLNAAHLAAQRFATLGTISVSVLAVTALFQGTLLSGGLTGLTGTAY